MPKKISLVVALIGYADFMAVAVLVARNSIDPHRLLWPEVAAIWMMAVGIFGFIFFLGRECRGPLSRATDALTILSKPGR